jgi:hypothetical protein
MYDLLNKLLPSPIENMEECHQETPSNGDITKERKLIKPATITKVVAG